MKKINWLYSGTKEQKVSLREKKHGEIAGEMASEGIVLLKNEEILPLCKNVSIALFGSGAYHTVKGGIGSGDVNNRENISIYRGLKEAGAVITSEAWLVDYEKRYDQARLVWKEKILEDAKRYENPFDAYAENPFVMPTGCEITPEDLNGAKAVIYMISRISGEGKDRRKCAGDYDLSEEEIHNLLLLNQKKIPMILMINAGGPVEIGDILEKADQIKAVLNISQLGQEGGRAVAEILFGDKTPSGKLTTTWAKHYEDYPFAKSFGYLNGDLENEEYKEDIFVGYRYFDSFHIPVLYPFGYGLSYTTFEQKTESIHIENGKIQVKVSVENTGTEYAGKDVVQLYLEIPRDGTNREWHRLVGFGKTGCLKPGEKQTVAITIASKDFASFSEKEKIWKVEKGIYGLCLGKSVAELESAAKIEIRKSVVLEETETLKHTCFGFEEQLSISECSEEKVDKTEKVYCFEPIPEQKKSISNICIAEQPVEELIPLFYGNITQGASTLGSAGIRVPGSAGETTEALEESYHKRSLIMADGPAGLRLRQSYDVNCETGEIFGVSVLGSLENGFLETFETHENADTYYQYCTAFPVGTAIAQTWNTELAERFGQLVKEEMEEFHVDLWLAPGMNIHRNPLCGRNYEYYSEDPLLSGKMASSVTLGVQSSGTCGVTIKHFACNNQEDHRMGVNACVTERALREIYLRGFEIAVKESTPISIMTSYNRINGVYSANNPDLCTKIVRDEWGFEGIIMSDWNTTVPEDGSIPWKCVAAGNDIIMPGNPNDDENIRTAYKNGVLSEQEIRESAGRILRVIEILT